MDISEVWTVAGPTLPRYGRVECIIDSCTEGPGVEEVIAWKLRTAGVGAENVA